MSNKKDAYCSRLDHIERFVEFLANPVWELRALRRTVGKSRPDIAYHRSARDFAEAVDGISKPATGADVYQGAFMTVNRLHDDFISLATGAFGPGSGTRDVHIVRRTALGIDVDPVRDHPDGGKVCTADQEHMVALEVVKIIREQATKWGMPPGLQIDSGNGCLELFRIDLPSDEDSTRLVEDVLAFFHQQFSSERASVDTSVSNASRVFRIPGSMNRKSPHTDTRPNRPVVILEGPGPDGPQSVPFEVLKELAERYRRSSGIVRRKRANGHRFGNSTVSTELLGSLHKDRVDAVLAYLEEHTFKVISVEDDRDYTLVSLAYCPIKGPKHTDGNSAILVLRKGGLAFKCFHEKCTGKRWSDLEKAIGTKFKDFSYSLATKAILGTTDRDFNDPLALAQKHLAKAVMADGTPTIAHFRGITYRFEAEEGWSEVTSVDLSPWVRATIQETYDEHAVFVSRLTGETEKPKAVRTPLVKDTYSAIESICRRDISKRVQPPFWLNKYDDWNAGDLLVLRNGILNLRHLLAGREQAFIGPTAKLFYEHTLDFIYDPGARAPATWFSFLESLEQDDEWYQALQQIVGYCLWLDYDLQKVFQIIGPPRSGKGTIANVLQNLVGGELAVCTPSLEDFGDQFGLEQAIGKRLAFVPEAHAPKDMVRRIVSRLKSVSGGDRITVGKKNRLNGPQRLKMKIFMFTNDFLALPDSSGALNVRTIPLRLTKSFRGREDTDLSRKLTEEYPGILNWALEGLKSLLESGGRFTLPESSLDELGHLLAESSPLQNFVDECCEIVPGRGVISQSLYQIYEHWWQAEHPNQKPMADNTFGCELKSVAPGVSKQREPSPGAYRVKGGEIVRTAYDQSDSSKRFNCWLGIVPLPQWRSPGSPVDFSATA